MSATTTGPKQGMFRALSAKLPRAPALNGSGAAGPRRLMLLAGSALGIVALVVAVAASGSPTPLASRDARMKPVDPLPGGLNSTPEQDALARKVDTERAEAALKRGTSYTPPIAPSQLVLPAPLRVEQPDPLPPTALPRPAPPVAAQPRQLVPTPILAAFPAALPVAAPASAAAAPEKHSVIKVASNSPQDQAAQAAYNRAVQDLFQQWGGRLPRTDVILPPERDGPASEDQSVPRSAYAQPRTREAPASRDAPAPQAVSAQADASRLLIPAGRGIYAHTILAVNSDASSPVVLQADSGPIAGDRMIGSFSKQGDRLVLRITSVVHNGETIGVDGVGIAPDTMEAAVASSVDQHYAERFILPAAAAFVAGLGQAIAQTSNTAAVLSPFGGVSTSTNLNFRQQLGIGAGAAAAQVGSVLNQAAPKGPTVALDANVSIGVMFLSSVVARGAQ